MPVLLARDLTVDLRLEGGARCEVVSDVSFAVKPASIVGVFGESGGGKSTLAMALTGLLPRQYGLRGSVMLNGREMLGLAPRAWEQARGAEISLIFQDPLLALNPVMRAGTQALEAMRAHRGRATENVNELFRLAGLPEPERIARSYPHELSGGERQRVLVALALACRPALVVADEPFTALDSARMLELASLFTQLKQSLGTSFLVISHHPGVLGRIADEVLVMYAGRIVESGQPRHVFGQPMHPYTKALMRSMEAGRGERLFSIPGSAPGLRGRPRGCAFEPRCEVRMDTCATRPPDASEPSGGRFVRCFQYGQ